MTTARSIVCGSCGADVPYGRLSCPACGDLLASVAGGTRRASTGDGLDLSLTYGAAPATSGRAATVGGQRITPAVLHDAFGPDESGGLDERGGLDEPGDLDVDDDLRSLLEPAAASQPAFAASPPPIIDGVHRPAPAADPPPYDPPPGAYVPPFAAASVTGAASMPAGPAAPARAWAGHAGTVVVDERLAGLAPGTSQAADAAGSETIASAARVTEFVGWLAIAGGALAAVGFLLPWGASMIGASGVDFFARWGLAGPFHLVAALGVVAIVVLAIVPNPVPSWIRVGLAGTILGTFLLGLVWPYVFGFTSTGPGAYAVGVGAAALLAAGIASLVSDRHAGPPPPV